MKPEACQQRWAEVCIPGALVPRVHLLPLKRMLGSKGSCGLQVLPWVAGLAHSRLPTPPHPPLNLGSSFSLFPLPTEGKHVHHASIILRARIHPELRIELRGGAGMEVSSPVPPAPACVTTPGRGAAPVSHPCCWRAEIPTL